MSKAGSRILGSVRKTRAFARGEVSEGFVVHVPEEINVKAIRQKLGLSQEVFALRFGFSPAAVRDWGQGRRQPEQAARVLLMVIDEAPQTVERVLRKVAALIRTTERDDFVIQHTTRRCKSDCYGGIACRPSQCENDLATTHCEKSLTTSSAR